MDDDPALLEEMKTWTPEMKETHELLNEMCARLDDPAVSAAEKQAIRQEAMDALVFLNKDNPKD